MCFAASRSVSCCLRRMRSTANIACCRGFTRSASRSRGRLRCATTRGYRRDLLCHGVGQGAALRQWRVAGIRRAGTAADVRAIGRHARRPPQYRSGGGGPRRLRQARQLFRAPGRALDPAISRFADRRSAGHGTPDRLSPGKPARAVARYRSSTATIASTMSSSTTTEGSARCSTGNWRPSAIRSLISPTSQCSG